MKSSDMTEKYNINFFLIHFFLNYLLNLKLPLSTTNAFQKKISTHSNSCIKNENENFDVNKIDCFFT